MRPVALGQDRTDEDRSGQDRTGLEVGEQAALKHGGGRTNGTEEEKRKARLKETDRMAVMTEALKAEGEKQETERQWGGKRASKLTAACHMEAVPNWPISRPQIEPAVFSNSLRAPGPH